MLFSKFKKYPRKKPKKDGWYLCKLNHSTPSMCVLHYDTRKDKWVNANRQSVFDGYLVYKVCRAPIDDNRVYTDSLSDCGHLVTAWRKLPNDTR